MGFRFTRADWRQHLLTGGLLAGALAVGATPQAAALWSGLVGAVPEWLLFVGGTFVVHKLVFVPFAALNHWVDRTGRPAFIARHRIQDGPVRRPPLGRVLRVLALNQLVLAPFLLAVLYGVLKLRGWSVEPALPGLLRATAELAGLGAIAVAVFYGTHRFLHRPWWMKKVHRVHHEFRTTTSLASEYAHPVEFCTGNFATLAVGVALLAPHLATVLLFEALAILTVMVHHSGYAVPWAPWAVHHDWHHYRVTEAFGTLGILDRLLGTDRQLRRLEDGQRLP